MKKLCIFLMKVNRFYYLLLGVLIGAVVYSQVGNVPKMIPFYDNPFILIFSLFVLLLIPVIAFSEFYTLEERKTKHMNDEIDSASGFVDWDYYFPTKINTELSSKKLFFGYIYAIFRPAGFLVVGYIFVLIFYVLR